MDTMLNELNQENNPLGYGWKDGPPVVGRGEGEIPPELAHISGRIFAEDVFMLAGQGDDGDDLFDFDGEEEEEDVWE